MTSTSNDTDAPLSPAAFQILLSVARDERHGYAIILDVAERSAGKIRLSPGTLYRTIQRMLELGWLRESAERPAAELDDERRRYYQITATGRDVARAEVARLRELVEMAEVQGLIASHA